MQKIKLESPWVVAVLALLFFIPFLGRVHLFDWDEINFAESAREMLVTGNYLRVQIDYQPFWEKPPLFIWLQALSMKVFGINEFAARFPNAVIGVITLLTFYYLGKRLMDARFGLLWALVYLGSVTPHLYFKSGIIDPWFNYFMFLSVVNLVLPDKKSSGKSFFWAGLFAGLAVWTKGPVGVGVPTLVLGALWVINYFRSKSLKASVGFERQTPSSTDGSPITENFTLKNLLIYGFTAGLLTLGWMLAIILESGWATFVAFLEYLYRLGSTSEADHGQPFYYHFVVVLIGCFPISVIGLPFVSRIFHPLLRRFRKRRSGITNPEQPKHGIANPAQLPDRAADRSSLLTPGRATDRFFNSMLCLFWVVMIVFSIVKTKIVHYSSMAYFPLSFLAALWLYKWLKGEIVWPRWMTVLLVVIGFVLSLVLTALPLVGMYAAEFIPYIDDTFVVANLQAPVEWAGNEWLYGVVYFGMIVFAMIIWKRRKELAIRMLFFSTAILLFFYTWVVVPKIEGYTQRAVINFYESKRGQDVYVWPIGNRSYAQFFYFKKPMGVRPEASDENWLLNGPVDKPTFLISRIDRAEEYRKNPNLELLKEENGFVFFRRKPDYQKISESLK
ncbi:glycosyltransferase family 39 protein [Runella sp.]|jgi:4-amino-4-deoxy-L-arabinose transferase-like glycosyltransferase|uniref:glycosyltransferase family 39 protein n=1 Tax=Runella sp. TaxID=1960881 RepID=UPI00260315D5|nr:glycosyltransferase family 39 protein [Runella sp.]